jgi:hypothetical protein
MGYELEANDDAVYPISRKRKRQAIIEVQND